MQGLVIETKANRYFPIQRAAAKRVPVGSRAHNGNLFSGARLDAKPRIGEQQREVSMAKVIVVPAGTMQVAVSTDKRQFVGTRAIKGRTQHNGPSLQVTAIINTVAGRGGSKPREYGLYKPRNSQPSLCVITAADGKERVVKSVSKPIPWNKRDSNKKLSKRTKL
jgi:hypothetical protein